jgi:hypothetical protein
MKTLLSAFLVETATNSSYLILFESLRTRSLSPKGRRRRSGVGRAFMDAIRGIVWPAAPFLYKDGQVTWNSSEEIVVWSELKDVL